MTPVYHEARIAYDAQCAEACADQSTQTMIERTLRDVKEVLVQLARIEHQLSILPDIKRALANLGDEIDALDRALRPYGDGTKLQRRRR